MSSWVRTWSYSIRENMCCCSPITSNASLLRHRNSLIQLFSSPAVILILNTYIIDVHQMFGTSLQTWKDLVFQDKSVILSSVTQGQNTTKTSSFSLLAWDPERLPPSAHLVENLPSRMQEHLGDIIDQHFSDKAASTSFTNCSDYSVTPDVVLGLLPS